MKMIMEGIKEKITGLKENFSNIVDTYVELAKVKAAEKLSGLISVIVAVFLALFLLIFFLFFVGIALSIWLGYLVDSMVAGFLIVAGIYLVLIFLAIGLRKKIILPALAKLIIKKIYG
jgi:hypothetical protein